MQFCYNFIAIYAVLSRRHECCKIRALGVVPRHFQLLLMSAWDSSTEEPQMTVLGTSNRSATVNALCSLKDWRWHLRYLLPRGYLEWPQVWLQPEVQPQWLCCCHSWSFVLSFKVPPRCYLGSLAQGWYRVLVSPNSWPGQLLSLNPCRRPKILARMLFLGILSLPVVILDITAYCGYWWKQTNALEI